MFPTITTTNLYFEEIRQLAEQGQNSEVFLAKDLQLNARVIVKKIDKSKFTDIDEYFRESKILYDTTHPNIVGIHYGCQDDDHIYISMPYYKHGSLNSLMDKRPLTVREIVRYGLHLLLGLHHVHTKGLIHMDIKPNNVMISNSDEGLLADFGLASYLDIYGETEPQFVYQSQVPPEFINNEPATFKYDIYMAGVCLYRMCIGNVAFNDQFIFANRDEYEQAILAGDYPNRKAYPAHIPHRLKAAINKALSVAPQERQSSILELMNDLSHVDDLFDWQYQNAGGVESWERIKDDHLRILIKKEVLANGGIVIATTRENMETGVVTNLRKKSGTFARTVDAGKLLLNNLKEL